METDHYERFNNKKVCVLQVKSLSWLFPEDVLVLRPS